MQSGNNKSVDMPGDFANDNVVLFTLREMREMFTNPKFWVGFVAVVIILAIAGPFGTSDRLNLPERLIYWACTGIATFSVGSFVSMAASLALFRAGTPEWLSRLAGGMVAGLPVMGVVWIINRPVFGKIFNEWDDLAEMTVYCIAIAGSVSIIYYLVSIDRRETVEAQHTVSTVQTPRFLKRLPVHLGQNLISLTTQDHYVEAVTEKGSHLVLMRFSDALEEVAEIDGLQIHRSHWIAKNAVTGTARVDGRLFVELANETRLPVSRSYMAAVKEELRI